MNPIFVLGLYDTGLAVASIYAQQGLDVFCFTHNPLEIGVSTTVARVFVLEDPRSHPHAFLEKLEMEAGRCKEKSLIIPASDIYVKFVSDYAERLKSRFLFHVPTPDLVDVFLSRVEQSQLAQSAGLGTPEIWENHEIKNLAKTHWVFPVFVKAKDNAQAQGKLSVKGYEIQKFEELEPILSMMQNKGIDAVVQEIIPGDAEQHIEVSGYIGVSGNVLCTYVIKKLRHYPSKFGFGAWIQETEHPECLALALKFCRNVGLTGFFNMEFKIDPRTNIPKYIETNIRVWQQIEMLEAKNIPILKLAYEDICKQNLVWQDSSHRDGTITWMDPLLALGSMARKDQFSLEEFRQYLSCLRQKNTLFAVWNRHDAKPSIKKFFRPLILASLMIRVIGCFLHSFLQQNFLKNSVKNTFQNVKRLSLNLTFFKLFFPRESLIMPCYHGITGKENEINDWCFVSAKQLGASAD